MKLNIAYPATGSQKLIEIDDEKKIRPFYEKRLAAEVPADSLGDEWKGYVFRITGGNDKQGFPMKQGVLTAGRVRLLLGKGHSCFRARRDGERKRKSVRGCIVDGNLSVLSMIIVKKGEQEIEGLTDKTVPRRLGPKRASKIRKLFNLSKEDDVRKYVVRKPLPPKEGVVVKKPRSKAPKIQRLITPVVLQRKRRRMALKRHRAEKRREEAAAYAQLLAKRVKEAKQRKLDKRRKTTSGSRSRDSKRESESAKEVVKPPAPKIPKSKVPAPAPEIALRDLKKEQEQAAAAAAAAAAQAKKGKGSKDAKGKPVVGKDVKGKPVAGKDAKGKPAPGKDAKGKPAAKGSAPQKGAPAAPGKGSATTPMKSAQAKKAAGTATSAKPPAAKGAAPAKKAKAPAKK